MKRTLVLLLTMTASAVYGCAPTGCSLLHLSKNTTISTPLALDTVNNSYSITPITAAPVTIAPNTASPVSVSPVSASPVTLAPTTPDQTENNLLINGSFELTPGVPAGSFVFVDADAVPGWQSLNGEPLQLHNDGQGSHYLELDAKNSTIDAIYQDIPNIVPGQAYLISMYVKAKVRINMEWNGVKTDPTGFNAPSGEWEYKEAVVYGTSQGSARLQLRESVTAGANDGSGALIDRVVVRPTNQLLANPSFECNRPPSEGFVMLDQDRVPGWRSLKGEPLKIVGTGYSGVVAPNGQNMLELDANKGIGIDGIYQDVPTKLGQKYILSLMLKARDSSKASLDDEEVVVKFNGVKTETLGYNALSGGWERIEIPITGTGKLDRIVLRESKSSGANDGTGPFIDSVELVMDASSSSQPVAKFLLLEAESASMFGTAIDTGRDASGDAFVDFLNRNGDYLSWTLTANIAGSTRIDFGYSLGKNMVRSMSLEVNGEAISDLAFAPTPDWSTWIDLSANVNLNVGANRIRLVANGQSGPNVDYLRVHMDVFAGPGWGSFTDALGPLVPQEKDIPIDSFFALGISISEAGEELNDGSVNAQTVSLINLSNGGTKEEIVINTTGGRDSLSITPVQAMKSFNKYRIEIDGVKAVNGDSYPYNSIEFTVGNKLVNEVDPEINFERFTVAAGDKIASLVFSADYKYLYAPTLEGSVLRWNVQSDGTLASRKEIVVGAKRTLIGLAIDPVVPNRLWITDNEHWKTGSFVPGFFSSKISYIDVVDEASFTGQLVEYLANSIVFGPDGLLYVSMGGNSAMGSPDAAWGNRPETLLSAAILTIDTRQSPPPGGFNVREPYDPFAANAPVKIYATGVRNAYDLLFHSNGGLYVPNNGSGAGGQSPDDPNTPANEFVSKGDTQPDLMFRIEKGGYYGHPNPARGEYIRDGGNPSSGKDPYEVPQYPVGTQPEPNFQGAVYNFGNKRSPNGIAEYTGGAFNGFLDGAMLVVEWSGGDRVVGLRANSEGDIVDNFVLASGFNNPLDVAVHAPTGNVYVEQFSGGLVLLKPM